MVCIRIGSEQLGDGALGRGVWAIGEFQVSSALEVVAEVLGSLPMLLARVGAEPCKCAHSEVNIWVSGNGKVEESTNKLDVRHILMPAALAWVEGHMSFESFRPGPWE